MSNSSFISPLCVPRRDEKEEAVHFSPHAAAATLPREAQRASHPPHLSHTHIQSLPGRMYFIFGALCMHRDSICRHLPSLTHLPFPPNPPPHILTGTRLAAKTRQQPSKHASQLSSTYSTMGIWAAPRRSPAGTPTCAAPNCDEEAPHTSRQARGTSAATATTHSPSPLIADSAGRAEDGTHSLSVYPSL